MNLVTKLKRKKLKSRKCLNELRKRLFNESDKDFSKDSNSAAIKINDSEKYVNIKPNSMIMSHFTLGFLKKAVQSETVTRHSLSSIQKSAISKNDITIFNECKSSLQQPFITSDKSKNSLTKIITSRDNNHFFYKAPPKSPSLFSSLKSDRTMVSSIEGSAPDSAEHLHVTSLKSLKNDSKGFGNSHFANLSSEILVEENPTTYIKVGYIRDAAAPQGDALSASTRSSCSLLCVSDIYHGSPVCLDDTPEYIYYPHRLNQ